MEAGSLNKVITIQEPVQSSDGQGGFTTTWVDWHNIDDWVALTAYAEGALVGPVTPNGYYYICSDAGTTGAAAPVWPTTVDATVDDGTVEWTCKSPKIRAAIWPQKAQERIESMKVELSITHRIRIRYLSGISTAFRVKYGSRYFNIHSIINVREANRELEFLAEELDGES